MKNLSLEDFNFELPEHLIAQNPPKIRSQSRLLDCLNISNNLENNFDLKDKYFYDFPDLLKPNDLIIFNDTKVIKARLFGQRQTGGKLEILIEKVLSNYEIIVHLKSNNKLKNNEIIYLNKDLNAEILGRINNLFYLKLINKNQQNNNLINLNNSTNLTAWDLIENYGQIPLPPYIKRENQENNNLNSLDNERYQSIFARNKGAIAAPTASLHFDELVLNRIKNLKDKNIDFTYLTLHVGAGTFTPIKVKNINDHKMHFEYYQIPEETINKISNCKKNNGRIIAIGTTCIRALEYFAISGKLNGETNIFIKPGFKFKIVDLLLTNFHLPKSTLLMLVSSFAGFENIQRIYNYSIKNNYKFFSYGDCMMLKKLVY